VPELGWLRTLLAHGCPLDPFAYLVEYEDSEKLLKFVERSDANDDEFRLETFQFDATAAWIDKLLQKWDLAQLPNDAQFIATFSKSFHVLRSDDYASQTRRYTFQNSYRQVERLMNDWSDAGRPIAECIYVAGYASNGQYYTGLIDQRELVEQRSTTSRPLATDSVRGADLTALRTSLPQTMLRTYVETIRSMPTPYGLVSTSQNLVEHQLTLTQPNQMICYSLQPKNVNEFMSFVRSQIHGATGRDFREQIWNYIDDRNHLHAMVADTLRFGLKPEFARADMDIEEFLRYRSRRYEDRRSECSNGVRSGSIDNRKHHRKFVSRHDKHVNDKNTRCDRSQCADKSPGG
jgi:hypothetical protein